METPKLNITYVPIGSLKPDDRNPRTHSRRQRRAIASSIRRFGFLNPILADLEGRIICGHGRWLAATDLGLAEVPTICLAHLTPEQLRAYIIADNQLAIAGGWDPELLSDEVKAILEFDAEFEVYSGFETAEIDLIIGDTAKSPKAAAVDAEVSVDLANATSRPGDLWILDSHRLIHGDARDPEAYRQLMGGDLAQMTFTDPPYNVRVADVVGRGAIKHREFPSASGEMSEAEFTGFLTKMMLLAASVGADGSLHYFFIDWRHEFELLSAGRTVFDEQKALCVWAKTTGGQGSLYRSQHELVAVFKKGTAPHRNNVQLGKFGRNRTNVWSYAGINTFQAGRLDALATHPTQKPLALVADAIKDVTKRGDIVLDPFIGSGTAIIAAEATGRRCYGVELDAGYVDAAIRRWQDYTAESATLVSTGQSFAEVAEERAHQAPSEVRHG